VAGSGGKLRELSGNRRSLDDFARAFFGVGNGDWDVNPYTFDDVVATLNGIAPYDWATFLRGRLDGHGSLTGGLELAAGSWSTAIRRTTPTRRRKSAPRRHCWPTRWARPCSTAARSAT
jgi:hypothetical protein